jgi:hypothetical protein
MSQLYAFYSSRKDVIDDFRGDLQKLATSPVYRKRMTYVHAKLSLIRPLIGIDCSGLLLANKLLPYLLTRTTSPLLLLTMIFSDL